MPEIQLGRFRWMRIASATMQNDCLRLVFAQPGLPSCDIYDDLQLCCENRWMTTDDDPSTIVGGRLLAVNKKPVEDYPDDGGSDEQMFVEVITDKGSITLCTHNEHNGYYGGFNVVVEDGDKIQPPC